MNPISNTRTRVLAGLLATAIWALPQGYTTSPKPGVLNYFEGDAFLDGNRLSTNATKATFLNANDTFRTDSGAAEILLTPGVFLRMGNKSQIRMMSLSLTNTQVEVVDGEAMIETAGLVKDNNVQIIDHGGSVIIEKNGLYLFTANNPPTAEVMEGKAEVFFGDKKIELKKGRQTVLGASLKAEKFDATKEDDLYAWSNVRSEYIAAASYQAANDAFLHANEFTYGGWYFDDAFDCWAWLPASGAFYSPFGWGFYAPASIRYAPIVSVIVYRGGKYWKNHPHPGAGTIAAVPANPKRPPAIGAVASSPASYAAARVQAAHSFAATGFTTAYGGRVSAGRAGFSGSGSRGTGRVSGGGFSGGSHASGGGLSGGGGGHASGGGAGHR